MHEDLHNDPFTDGSFVPHIPAAQGWQNMEALLNTHLPAQRRGAVWWLTGLQISAVAMVLLLVSVPTKDSWFSGIFPSRPQKNISQENIKVTPVNPASPALSVVEKGVNGQSRQYPFPLLFAAPVQSDVVQLLPESNRQWADMLTDASPISLGPDTLVCTSVGVPADSFKKADTSPKRWQLLAGVGTNYVAGGSKQHMVPYPTAELRYFVSKKMYVAAGISIGSPVASDEKTVENTITYYDQPTNETKTVNQIRNIDRGVYTDVPVTAGIVINKHWSVAAGAQMSFLNKIVSHRYTEPHNDQVYRTVVFSPGLVGPTAVVEDRPKTDLPVPQKDFRGLAALTWQAGKWQVTGQYQRSFSQGQKNIVSLKLQFRLK